MKRVIVFIIFCYAFHARAEKESGKKLMKTVQDPDVNRNVSELITSKGYPVEEHTVETSDGYLLSVQRIPYGRTGNSDKVGKEAVLLIHGILADASNWVLNFPGQSLGFVLSDEGYDVWLLNTRGCNYSKKHKKYTTKDYKFWDFSFEQVAQYDVPATIDYILKSTGKRKIFIIGHSQGTTEVFAMLSEMPDYNDKVKLFIALAPVAFVGHATPYVVAFVPFARQIEIVSKMMYAGEFFPLKWSKKLMELIYDKDDPEHSDNILLSMSRMDSTNINKTRFAVYFAHGPSSTSTKSGIHYIQLKKSKKFRKYDYGRHGNLKLYKQEEPPDYDVSRITTPIALVWSKNDEWADFEDVDILRKQLNSIAFDYKIPQQCDHIDFIIGLNAPKLINEPVLQMLSEF